MSNVFVVAGSAAVALAAAGIFLPLVPTTPFLLLAAFCYARGSPRCHAWLLQHRWFGPIIDNWQSGRGMTAQSKATTIIVMAITMGVSVIFVASWVARASLLFILVAVSCFLLSRPTTPRID